MPPMKRLALALPLMLAAPAAAQEAEPPTPASIVAASRADEWVAIAPEDLLVMDLAPDAAGHSRRVVIQLMPAPFSQPWVENIRTLARARWWDGTQVYRVVDNWVAQWGAGEDGGEAGFVEHPLPEGVVSPVADYTSPMDDPIYPPLKGDLILDAPELSRLEADLHDDVYAQGTYFHDGWPLATDLGRVWPVHCYASVGVARDLAPDTGTGAELYAVIGHAPRQLDRNIAVVGRVIAGIEHLSTLPRGTAEAGVYATRAEDVPIVSVRLGSEMAPASSSEAVGGREGPPRFEYLGTNSESFARYVQVRANRSDAFYTVPAGGVDVCNVQVPIRPVTP
jgi:peptidylprolyl isomerase